MKDSKTLRERVIEAGQKAYDDVRFGRVEFVHSPQAIALAAARTALEVAKERIEIGVDAFKFGADAGEAIVILDTLLADLGVGSHGIERVCEAEPRLDSLGLYELRMLRLRIEREIASRGAVVDGRNT